MGILHKSTNSSGTRNRSVSDFSEITTMKPDCDFILFTIFIDNLENLNILAKFFFLLY